MIIVVKGENEGLVSAYADGVRKCIRVPGSACPRANVDGNCMRAHDTLTHLRIHIYMIDVTRCDGLLNVTHRSDKDINILKIVAYVHARFQDKG